MHNDATYTYIIYIFRVFNSHIWIGIGTSLLKKLKDSMIRSLWCRLTYLFSSLSKILLYHLWLTAPDLVISMFKKRRQSNFLLCTNVFSCAAYGSPLQHEGLAVVLKERKCSHQHTLPLQLLLTFLGLRFFGVQLQGHCPSFFKLQQLLK